MGTIPNVVMGLRWRKEERKSKPGRHEVLASKQAVEKCDVSVVLLTANLSRLVSSPSWSLLLNTYSRFITGSKV